MMKKTLIVSTLAAGVALAALPAAASHRDDRAAGAIIGGTIGALIGNSVNGGDGALVGGAIGALAGAGIADAHVGYGYGYAAPYYGTGYAAPYYGYGYAPRYYSAPVRTHYSRPWGARDSDGDGVRNRWDRAPYNPRWR